MRDCQKKINIWPKSEASRANMKFWGQSLSQLLLLSLGGPGNWVQWLSLLKEHKTPSLFQLGSTASTLTSAGICAWFVSLLLWSLSPEKAFRDTDSARSTRAEFSATFVWNISRSNELTTEWRFKTRGHSLIMTFTRSYACKLWILTNYQVITALNHSPC